MYLAAAPGNIENGSAGGGRLYIGQYLDSDTLGVPPTVQITSPAPSDTVIEESILSILVDAVDDVAVAAVSLLVDGEVTFTDTTAPYQFTFKVPLGISGLVIGAEAIDIGNNVGVATDASINVIPDPLTTVIGRGAMDFSVTPCEEPEPVPRTNDPRHPPAAAAVANAARGWVFHRRIILAKHI